MFLGLFLKITWELHEDSTIDSIDKQILVWISHLRAPMLNGSAVDMTALGSASVIAIFAIIGIVLLWLKRDRKACFYLATGSMGAGVGTYILKYLFTRIRPSVVPRLVEVSGFSYPSGHSFAGSAFYLLLMFITWRHYDRRRDRVLILICTGLVIMGVCFSRLYLGVHYPSDVLSGLCLGISWVLLLTAYFFKGELGQNRDLKQK